MYYNHSYLNLNEKNNNYKNEKLINNFLNNKKNNKKIERTVEDIIKYDETNRKYALFITKILNSINKGIIINFKNNKNGYELENLSYKLALICIKIKKSNNFIPRPVQILAILRLADSVFNSKGKGSIKEIKTGEGKSFIVSTLAILLCQFNQKIDIITSNIELVEIKKNKKKILNYLIYLQEYYIKKKKKNI